MKQQELKLAMSDGIADVLLYTADDGSPLPGVLLLPDVWGLRDTMKAMALRLAEQGYTVLMPNSFYRISAPPVFPFTRAEATPQQVMQRIHELLAPLTATAIAEDTRTYIDFLTSQKTTQPVPIGVVGVCIGGLMSFRAAAATPDKIKVVASFHGGGLYKFDDTNSPHHSLHKITAKLYFGHAIDDNSMNAEAIAALDHALDQWGGRFTSEVYEGAHHGWTVADNPSYNPPQAERAWATLTALFKEELHETEPAS